VLNEKFSSQSACFVRGCPASIHIDQTKARLPVGIEQHSIGVFIAANEDFLLFILILVGVVLVRQTQRLRR